MSSNNQQNQITLSGESARTGVVADDYDPEAIGTAVLEAGEPIQVWEDYGLEMVPVLHDGDDTGRRFVRRNGKFIADVSERYKLLPNERVVQAADQVAEELGAVPFHEHSGDWYVQLDDHVFQDEERRRVHALYSFDTREVGDSDVEYGFAVHNSIDKSMAFEVGLFTFRHACANMVLMGVGGEGMNFDQREVVTHQKHRHTASLDIENLELVVKGTLSMIDQVDDTYQAWRDEFLRVEDVLQLIEYFPDKVLPDWMVDIGDAIDEQRQAAAEDDEVFDQEDAKDLALGQMPATQDIWTNYNDITQNIWHDDGSNDKTKYNKFSRLHRVYQPSGANL